MSCVIHNGLPARPHQRGDPLLRGPHDRRLDGRGQGQRRGAFVGKDCVMKDSHAMEFKFHA